MDYSYIHYVIRTIAIYVLFYYVLKTIALNELKRVSILTYKLSNISIP